MKVFVVIPRPGRAPVALTVSKDDTLASVKEKLHDMEGIPPWRQRLVFAYSALPDDDDTTLADHGVTDLSTFQLVKTMMEVFVRTSDRTLTINGVESSDTVENFRIKVQEKDGIRPGPVQQRDRIGIRPASQRLMYAGKQMEDGHTLAYYDIQNDITMHLACRPCTFRTRLVELEIEVTDTVARIKERVEEAEGIRVACQSVCFRGNELDDGCALADYGALESSTPVKIACKRPERCGTTNMTIKGEASVLVETETVKKRTIDIEVGDPDPREKMKNIKRIKSKPLTETDAVEIPAAQRRRFPVYLIGPELRAICRSSCDIDPAY